MGKGEPLPSRVDPGNRLIVRNVDFSSLAEESPQSLVSLIPEKDYV